MKVVNNSDEYNTYTREQHIENLNHLTQMKKQAQEFGSGMGGIVQMMNLAVKAAFIAGLSAEEIAQYSQLSVAQLDNEPGYWLISPLSENREPLIGGVAYVVNKDNRVFETSGSLPPSARIQAAKAS